VPSKYADPPAVGNPETVPNGEVGLVVTVPVYVIVLGATV